MNEALSRSLVLRIGVQLFPGGLDALFGSGGVGDVGCAFALVGGVEGAEVAVVCLRCRIGRMGRQKAVAEDDEARQQTGLG